MEWGQWTGRISEKNMLEIGKITSSKDGVFIFGFNLKGRVNSWEIAMKVTGRQVYEMDLVFFIMLMDLNTKATGKITWKKDILFTLMKMVKCLWFFFTKIEWSNLTSLKT